MVCGLNSAGPDWYLVELESPATSVLRSDGQARAEFTHARQQIADWRIWLRDNSQYAQHQLGFEGLDSEFKAIIIMGRRADVADEHRKRYRELSRDGVEVMSYDRLTEQVTNAARSFRELVDSLKSQAQ